MRIDNRKVKNIAISVYFLLILFAVVLSTAFSYANIYTNNLFVILLGLFFSLILFHSIAGYFEYDSDGGKIVVINRGLILTEYVNYREHKVEFARSQLIGFKIKNFIIYKSLILLINDYEDKKIKERFNVTLLKRKRLKYVKQSLVKMVKENRKYNTI